MVLELFRFLPTGEEISVESKQPVDAGLHMEKRDERSGAERQLATKARNDALGTQRAPVIVEDKPEMDNENLFTDKEEALKVCSSFIFICFLVVQLKG